MRGDYQIFVPISVILFVLLMIASYQVSIERSDIGIVNANASTTITLYSGDSEIRTWKATEWRFSGNGSVRFTDIEGQRWSVIGTVIIRRGN